MLDNEVGCCPVPSLKFQTQLVTGAFAGVFAAAVKVIGTPTVPTELLLIVTFDGGAAPVPAKRTIRSPGVAFPDELVTLTFTVY